MRTPIVGLHHVTAIASDPQRNLDFYTQVLGLRFVKRTVNFDDPETYHFYFGDDIGTPGTILTFFPWPGTPRGRRGAGETIATAFSIPVGSMSYWRERLRDKGISTEENVYFDGTHLSFSDPDGMEIELVEHTEPEAHGGSAWHHGLSEARRRRKSHPLCAGRRCLRSVFGCCCRQECTDRAHGRRRGASHRLSC